jgi:hypothetical protein
MSMNYSGHWRRMLASMALVLFGATAAMAQWTTVGSVPEPLHFAAQTYLDGKLYTFGGYVGNSYVMQGEKLDVTAPGGNWTPTVMLPSPRAGAFAAAIGGKIYIVGGSYNAVQNNQQVTVFQDTVLEYNPATNTLTKKGVMPVSAANMAATVANGKIYLMGGLSRSGSNLVLSNATLSYDPATNTWAQLQATPTSAYNWAATAVGNDIYLVGGQSVNASGQGILLNSAFKGTISGNTITWNAIANYPAAVRWAAGGTIADKPVFAGGNTILNNALVPIQNTFYYDGAAWKPTYYLPVASYEPTHMPGDGSSLYYISGIENRKVFKLTMATETAVASLSRTNFVLTLIKGQAQTLTPVLSNLGVKALNFTVEVPSDAPWLIANPTSGVIAAPQGTALTPPGSQNIALRVSTANLELGAYTTVVNVKSDDPAAASTPVTVTLFVVPAKGTQPINAVVEEATGTWCQYCPQGYDSLKAIERRRGDRSIIISHHYGDPMQLEAGLSLLDKWKTSGYPSAAIQRTQWPTEPEFMTNRGSWGRYADQVINTIQTAPVTVEVSNFVFDADAMTVKATVKATVHEAIPVGSLRLTTIVTQDSIIADQQTINGQVLYDYVHLHVARALLPDEDGAAFDVQPGDIFNSQYIRPGTVSTMEVEYTVPNAVGGAPAYDFPNMHAVFVVHGFENGVPTMVFQGQEIRLKEAEPIEILEVTSDRHQATVAPEEEATFTATVRNLTATPREVTITRAINAIPSGWASRICVGPGGNTCSDPATSSEVISIPAGGTALVRLKVAANTANAQGDVTLNFVNGTTVISQGYVVNSTNTGTGVEEEISAGASLSISDVYPNPASEGASIKFGLAAPGKALIEVYSLDGVKVATLVDGRKSAGTHRIEFSAAELKSGTYSVVLTAGGRKVSTMMTVVH